MSTVSYNVPRCDRTGAFCDENGSALLKNNLEPVSANFGLVGGSPPSQSNKP
jgi:hypothetical protein